MSIAAVHARRGRGGRVDDRCPCDHASGDSINNRSDSTASGDVNHRSSSVYINVRGYSGVCADR